ncbi:membrane lipoprotein lipid attachment site-containing protein [Vibrio fluvialis]
MKRLLTILCAVAALSACASKEIGKPINYAKLDRLTLGISTQEDVKVTLGYPQSIIYPDNRTIYQYRYKNDTGGKIYIQAVDTVFNKNQRLIDITINDGLNDFKFGDKE